MTAVPGDLQAVCGLPVGLDRRGRLRFSGGLEPVVPAVRTAAELRPVLMDGGRGGRARGVYYMYRGVCLPEHRALFARQGLRYDLTVLRPGTLGPEYVKTFGHYHPLAPGGGLAYPEVYEVVAGRAHFLLQKPAAPGARAAGAGGDAGEVAVEDVVLVEAGPRDKVLIPPGYGHVTVNPGADWLVLANLVAAEFQAVYEPYKSGRGAAYYEVAGRGFVANPHYGPVPALRRLPPHPYPQLGLVPDTPLYRAFVADPARFRFLRRPDACLPFLREPGTGGGWRV